MRIAYVHGYDGITAPLFLGALLALGASPAKIVASWQLLQLPPVELNGTPVPDKEMTATQVTWTPPERAWTMSQGGAHDLFRRLLASTAPTSLQQRVLHMLEHFTNAVAYAHGREPASVEAMSSPWLPEILYLGSAVACALDELAIDQLVAAPVPLGTGWIDDAAGRRPVPHPYTAALCRGVPIYSTGVPPHEERTTVAGAALLTAFASHFGPPPDMTLVGAGYGQEVGAPTTAPRHLQVLLGDTVGPAAAERIAVMEANIDDMNPEFYESIAERLFAHGALDVTLTPLYMKKNRPATTLTVLAPLPAVSRLAQAMLQETSTFGVRVHEVWRHKLDRFHRPVETHYGSVPVKCGVLEGRIVQAAPEYDACKRLAREQGVPVRLVYAAAASLAASWLAGPAEPR